MLVTLKVLNLSIPMKLLTYFVGSSGIKTFEFFKILDNMFTTANF